MKPRGWELSFHKKTVSEAELDIGDRTVGKARHISDFSANGTNTSLDKFDRVKVYLPCTCHYIYIYIVQTDRLKLSEDTWVMRNVVSQQPSL